MWLRLPVPRRTSQILLVEMRDNVSMMLCAVGYSGCPGLLWSALLVMLWCVPAVHAQDAVSLKAHHAAVLKQLASNQFQRPIYLESSENAEAIKGDIYAEIQQPYAVVAPALENIDHWCDIFILHLNVKKCVTSVRGPRKILGINIGRKSDQPLSDTLLFEFAYRVVAAGSDYLQMELNAEKGPLGTSNYRIALEVTGLDAQHGYLHMSYSYAYGNAARVAMLGYLATTGRNKVGFSIAQTNAKGQPIYVGGMRGVIERNTMRYYLAVEAFLGALSTPMPAQIERRLHDWYAGVERYPVQLHELGRDEYLDMKRKERSRQSIPGS